MSTYYAKGVLSFNEELNVKIKRDSIPNWWYQDDYDRKIAFDNDFTGYVDEKDKVFDISHILTKRDEKKHQEAQKKRVDKFRHLQDCILKSTEEVENYGNQLDTLSKAKGQVRKLTETLRKGYVTDDKKIGGSKRRRRYKKDSRRFLTDKEIEKMEKDKDYYQEQETHISIGMKLEDLLYKIIRRMDGITQERMGRYFQAYGYHLTEGIYSIFEQRFESLKGRVNGVARLDMLMELEKKKKKPGGKKKSTSVEKNPSEEGEEPSAKDSDNESEEETINIRDVKVFEETYQKVLERVEEDKHDEEMMTVQRERAVTNRARHYIDENGNRVELGSDVRQVVLHN